MKPIYNKIFLKHKTENHPECPERLLAFGNLEHAVIENGEKYLGLVYDGWYIEAIKDASRHGMHIDADTYASKRSYEAACYAVGAAVMAAKENNFALIRPPGHHATKNRAMGFCLFNNIAIAAQYLANQGKRIFILDFDGHHGNGTQDIFYETDKVLYLSTHQYPAYPGSGWVDEIGEGDGKYFTINIPMPPNSSDDIFIETLTRLIPIIKKKFQPDIVGVSAGFDAYRADPLLQLNLSVNSYYEIGRILSANFKNIFACLEGGYNTKALPHCVYAFLDGINNKKIDLKSEEERTVSAANVKREFEARMKKLKYILRVYWSSDL